MENAVTVAKNNAVSRDITIITAEIKDIRRQAQNMAMLYAVEIGRRLVEAKDALPYGQWGDWLKNEVEFSQSSANNFMRLFEEYGSAQLTIFGATVDSQTIGNLPYSKALQLLAIPKEERETFAKEVDAEHLSVSELKQAIAERDRERSEKEEAQAREAALAERVAELEAAQNVVSEKSDESEALKAELETLRAEKAASEENARQLQEKLKKAEKDPTIPKKKLDEIRKEAETAAKEQAEKAAEKRLAEAEEKVAAANAELNAAKIAEKDALAKLEDAQKKLKTATPEVAAFKTLFDQMQGIAERLQGMLRVMTESDPATAAKLSAAMKAFGESLQG